MAKPLLIHSLSELDEVILGLVDRCQPTSVLEIGSEDGGFSEQLHERCQANGASLDTIELVPSPAVLELAKTADDFHLFTDRSLSHLAEHGCRSQLVIIDGDHNWFTVHNELVLIAKSWAEWGTSGCIILHHVSWPCARRDSYSDPRSIPPEALHPHRADGGPAWAVEAGGPCNGVLTAIEDFLAAHPGWTYRSIDAVFGLGCLTRTGSADDAHAEAAFAPYRNSQVGRLEADRLALYLKVVELQSKREAA